ncbi:unnamed protein product [Polarella glacialis]|uniref:Cytochrome c domain-containing protein n=1 Tax=Polarella glacialis TaxID=89957 RepID=A0A813DHQ2_POLGL|nr:unnamed protein product [Polarella glacialis]CAE8720547.1 unnamed protein product [Polarella glacialis]|mmetsp:Transcript_29260/g.46959  ORF Transcript_29260/g.46959 Transcript_29260/m.46959 type:complete len:225 (-) Transcript_29260:105-779(-)
MACRREVSVLVALCLVGLGAHAFVVSSGRVAAGAGPSAASQSPALASLPSLEAAASGAEEASCWSFASRFLAGAAVGAFLLAASASPARADVDDVLVPVDGKGKTVMLTKEGLNRGKRLFNNACATCHVGGGTRTNQNVGLGIEELKGSTPPRDNIESLVDYQNNPTTYDGLKDISEVHPSIRGADIWPKMQSMKQSDLYDISAYMLYMTATIPEKWGGGKQYY